LAVFSQTYNPLPTANRTQTSNYLVGHYFDNYSSNADGKVADEKLPITIGSFILRDEQQLANED